MRKALKADGRLVLIEYRKEDPTIPIRPEHKMSAAEVKGSRGRGLPVGGGSTHAAAPEHLHFPKTSTLMTVIG
jgi:hypothetical protein